VASEFELGEIEVVLTQHPAVEQALVVAVKMWAGWSRNVVTRKQAPTGSDLRQFPQNTLARDTMVPRILSCSDAFPLTPNRKWIGGAADPGRSRTDRGKSLHRTSNPIEQRIADILDGNS